MKKSRFADFMVWFTSFIYLYVSMIFVILLFFQSWPTRDKGALYLVRPIFNTKVI
jgi:hypothetical protein